MYLPQKLVGKHNGKVIGVLGSGPTLNDFKDKINDLCDVVIACNGSLLALDPGVHYVDYFMYYDGYSFKRDWFFKSRDFYQRPNLDFPILNLFNKKTTIRISGCEPNEAELQDEVFHFEPKVIKYNSNFALKYGRDIIYNWCTITGLATQMAYNMGAKQISLFGCSFDNDSGRNYAYISEIEDRGNTYNHQRIAMDNVIRKVKQKGIDVVSYGDTRLIEPKIIQGVFFEKELKEFQKQLGYKL